VEERGPGHIWMAPARNCRKEGQKTSPTPPVLGAEEPLLLVCPSVAAEDAFPGGRLVAAIVLAGTRGATRTGATAQRDPVAWRLVALSRRRRAGRGSLPDSKERRGRRG
jgi:hypothetical protein